MSYTFFNLDALTIVANVAQRLGYNEYWGIDEKRGHCILRQAVDFIYPYVMNPETFPYSEYYPEKQKSGMARMLLTVAKRFPNEGYEKKAEELGVTDMEWLLEPIR